MTDARKRILIIDDEESIRALLRTNLESHGFEIVCAETGQSGLQLAADFHPHLIILDLGLPDIDGFQVLKRLREWTKIPILVLTVNDNEETKVELLDAGADDYLTKPFGLPELLARIRVGLRHHGAIEATPIFISEDLRVDLNLREVTLKDAKVKLTSTEYELLSLLIRSAGRVVSQSHLLISIWGPNAVSQSHYLRIYVAQLRKKL